MALSKLSIICNLQKTCIFKVITRLSIFYTLNSRNKHTFYRPPFSPRLTFFPFVPGGFITGTYLFAPFFEYVPTMSKQSFKGYSYISRTFKQTAYIRDIYETCTKYIRHINKAGTKQSRTREYPALRTIKK